MKDWIRISTILDQTSGQIWPTVPEGDLQRGSPVEVASARRCTPADRIVEIRKAVRFDGL